jgi:signal peptidase I
MKSEDDLRRERRRGWIIVAILLPPAIVFFVTLKFITTHHLVPSGSMIPTVHERDRVFVNRFAYTFGEKPKVGDVVAYRQEALLLHRIVAGPGDTIEMRDNVVFLNGKRRHEPYTIITPDVPAVRSFGPLKVPPGQYFLMGDNRDNANDSRFRGFISDEQIKGRMIHVLHVGRCEQ